MRSAYWISSGTRIPWFDQCPLTSLAVKMHCPNHAAGCDPPNLLWSLQHYFMIINWGSVRARGIKGWTECYIDDRQRANTSQFNNSTYDQGCLLDVRGTTPLPLTPCTFQLWRLLTHLIHIQHREHSQAVKFPDHPLQTIHSCFTPLNLHFSSTEYLYSIKFTFLILTLASLH